MEIKVKIDDVYIKVTKEVVSTMLRYTQMERLQHESGGILIGRQSLEKSVVIIEYLTTPDKKDKSTRTTFIRRDKSHQEYMDKIWKEQGNIHCYVGEWHTHPEDNPQYSNIDYNNWLRLGKNAKTDMQYYFFIIVGRKKIGMWSLDRKLKRVTKVGEMLIINEDNK